MSMRLIKQAVICLGVGLLFLVTPALAEGVAQDVQPAAEASLPAAQKYFDGRRWRQLWLNPQEVVEFGPSDLLEEQIRIQMPTAKVIKRNKNVRIWRLGEQGLEGLTRGLKRSDQSRVSPVYHLSKRGGQRLALVGNVIVKFKADISMAELEQWAVAHGLRLVRVMAQPGKYLLSAGSAAQALAIANQVQQAGEVVYATPEWWTEAQMR